MVIRMTCFKPHRSSFLAILFLLLNNFLLEVIAKETYNNGKNITNEDSLKQTEATDVTGSKIIKDDTKSISILDELSSKRQYRKAVEVSSDADKCYGNDGFEGVCVPYESCFGKPLKEDIKRNTSTCVTDDRKVGVCCTTLTTTNDKRKNNGFKPLQTKNVSHLNTGKLRLKRNTLANSPPRSIQVENINVTGSKIINDNAKANPILDELSSKRQYRKAVEVSSDADKCYGNDGFEGLCVPYESCFGKPLKEDIKRNTSTCVTDDRKVGVCCTNSTTANDKRKNSGLKPVQIKNISHLNTGKLRSKRNTLANSPPRSIQKEKSTCGRNGNQLSENLKKGSWPWIGSLKVTSTMNHFCGSTLISRYHLLTAAHCFVTLAGNILKEKIFVRLGDYDFKNKNRTNYNDHKISEVIVHEDFDLFTNENDIAILVLERPAHYSVYIQPICLPLIEKYNGKIATVIGWGHIKRGGPGSDILKEIGVPLWEHASCDESIGQTIFQTNVCAGEEDGSKDSCQNDSGGPLMIERDNKGNKRWEIAGIVSWGIGCGNKGRPGVYTQVNKYLDWIYEKLSD